MSFEIKQELSISDNTDDEDVYYDTNKKRNVPDYFDERDDKKFVIQDVYGLPSTSSLPSTDYNKMGVVDDIERKIKNKTIFNRGFFSIHKQLNEESDAIKFDIRVRCELCLPKIKYLKGSVEVTSNFIKHLKNIHPESYVQYIEYKREKQTNCTGNFYKTSQSKVKQDIFDAKILNFMIDTMIPMSVLSRPSFRNLFEATSLTVMCMRTAMKKLDLHFDELTSKIKYAMAKSNVFCTTVDIWSCKKRTYLGYTCHWLDNNFNRYSAALACKRFDRHHSSDRIAEFVNEVYTKYNLNHSNIMATVTDNGSNFIKDFREFGINLNREISHRETDVSVDDAILDEQTINFDQTLDVDMPEFIDHFEDVDILFKHIRCASHTISLLATTDFINALKSNESTKNTHVEIFSKCSNLWNKVGDPKSSEIIFKVLGQSLSYPVVTRWNSIYKAVKKILSHKDKIDELCTELWIPLFSKSDLAYLDEYCMVMCPLAEAIDFLQGEKKVYYGYLIPTLTTIKTRLIKLSTSGNIKFLQHVLNHIQISLVNRFQFIFELQPAANDAIIASVTCPFIKTRWFHVISATAKDRSINDIYNLVIDNANVSTDSDDLLPMETVQHDNMLASFFDFGESEEERPTRTSASRNMVENEFRKYMQEIRSDVNVLENYPIISKLFIKYNTALPSSAPVEQLFSFTEIINAPGRHEFSDAHFEKMVLIKANATFFRLE